MAFKVLPIVHEIGRSSIEYKITVVSNFSSHISAQNVIVKIPTPLTTANVDISVPIGKAKYVPSENAIVWKLDFLLIFRIYRFQGASDYTLTANANLVATNEKKSWSKPPISLDFQVLMFTSSGIMIRFLKVFEKSNYETVKWVRYITKAGTYEFRI